PERIDDSALEQRLARFPASAMSASELLAAFPPPNPADRAARDSTRRIRQAAAERDSMQAEPMRAEAMQADAASARRARRAGGGRQQRGPQAILFDLAGAKLQRAVYSERQLQEVMTDFWFNHFNVFFGKNLD